MIEKFRGDYFWLSNFSELETPIVYKGIHFYTVEHFYQAMKFKDIGIIRAIAEHPSEGLKSLVRVYRKHMRPDFKEIRTRIMFLGLKFKFSDANPIHKQLLLSTGKVYIQEGNTWGDTYWGVCLKTGKGENTLGKLIMSVRKLLTPTD